MKIEHGKFYKTRSGCKVGPAKMTDQSWSLEEGFVWSLGGAYLYRENGTTSSEPDDYVVAEWVEGPVRTVTRTEIVGGVYGAVQITAVYDDGVNIYANSGKWSADDLRAAAATFIEIADALPLNAEGSDK